jgi:acyl-CoA dehydrogenase
MISLILDFLYWPISYYIALFLGVALFVIWFQWPIFVLTVLAGVLLWASAVDETLLMVVLAAGTLVSVPIIRSFTLSKIILLIAQTFKIFPKVSQTERAALDAGSVWMDKELFSGAPNIPRLINQPIKGLMPHEQDFLDHQVETLCSMINDWEIQKTKQIPDAVWEYVKQQKFLGMIIPREHGGLGLSAIGHSAVIERIASVSATMAITIMVPNSLGPAELLLHYGTPSQKDQYLSKLATGEEMPCFGLTEPTAGSDAGGLQSEGVVFRADDGELNIKFNWNKRWITLSGISTVIGLAFLLKDPNQLLGGPTDYGITCALIPTNAPGVDVSKRHDPLGVPFMNCPTVGTNVIMPLSCIIGERDGMGRGWTMLMDCLSAGRGISLPSLSLGGAQSLVLAVSSFGLIREQFGMSIGQFEGIQEPLARIVGKTFILKAGRHYTCGAIDQGEKPSVISAILKLHSTEMFREIVNDSMDILGGAGITQGPRNIIASAYKAAPIGITVEGANILTRTLIIFGQGALRCHPFAHDEVMAAEANDVRRFDRAFFGHIGHVASNILRMSVLTATRGMFSYYYGRKLSPYFRRLVWVSSIFSVMADASMLVFGGGLKAKQKITGRLADMLSWMYLASATMAYEHSLGNQRVMSRPVVDWALNYCFYNIQVALIGIFENFSWVTRFTLAPLFRWLPVGKYPSDKSGQAVAILAQQSKACRDLFASGVYVPSGNQHGLSKLMDAHQKIMTAAPAVKKIRAAIRSRVLPKQPISQLVALALQKQVISAEEAVAIETAQNARMDAIQVDAFSHAEYLKNA